jgi:hypothetical protein
MRARRVQARFRGASSGAWARATIRNAAAIPAVHRRTGSPLTSGQTPIRKKKPLITRPNTRSEEVRIAGLVNGVTYTKWGKDGPNLQKRTALPPGGETGP